ncbi:MAG: OmpH family outer membrane protein [Vibrio sp.]
MKKFIKVAGISLAILTSSLAATAAQAAGKIGYVDSQAVMHALPLYKSSVQKWEKEGKSKKAQLDRLESQFKAKADKLNRDAKVMSATDVQNARIDLQSMQQKLEVQARTAQADLAKTRRADMQKIGQSVETAINKVSKAQGYDMVVEKGALLYAKPEGDLTNAVIKALR